MNLPQTVRHPSLISNEGCVAQVVGNLLEASFASSADRHLENSTAQSPQTSEDEGQQVEFYSKVVFDVFASFLKWFRHSLGLPRHRFNSYTCRVPFGLSGNLPA